MDRGALAGCSPWSHKQLDTTEVANTFLLTLVVQQIRIHLLMQGTGLIPGLGRFHMLQGN